MADPPPPNIPADAPQDVKDFFECKGDKLVWKKGKVSWLTIKVSDDVEVTPEVSFEHGKAAGSVQISVSLAGVSGTVGASVNAEGQLVVDDVSLLLKPFKDKINDAVKTINEWFKHNKKKLKPAVLKKGEVTLAKTATTLGYAPPAVIPFGEDENQNKPENVGLTPGVATEEGDSAVAQTTVGPARHIHASCGAILRAAWRQHGPFCLPSWASCVVLPVLVSALFSSVDHLSRRSNRPSSLRRVPVRRLRPPTASSSPSVATTVTHRQRCRRRPPPTQTAAIGHFRRR